MAPVIARLAADPRFEPRVCSTGQHRRLLDQVLMLFRITPDHDLDVMRPDQDLHNLTARLLLGIRDVLRLERPDVVIVHGDTTTCMVAALAAFYEGVPVAHVEAGLRSGHLQSPFPEEFNRLLADRLSCMLFAPTARARDNLLKEGIPPDRIRITGNTGIDALLSARGAVAHRTLLSFEAAFGNDLCEAMSRPFSRRILVTGHRRESFGAGVTGLCAGIFEAARRHPEWLFVYPVHLNPSVQKPVRAKLGDLPNVVLAEPLEYAPFVWLMDKCDLVLTDSGGIQEEAPALGKPVLVLRDVTERPEGIEAGTARLVGTDAARIVAGLESVLGNEDTYLAMSCAHSPYGDGHAADRISDALAELPTAMAVGDAA